MSPSPRPGSANLQLSAGLHPSHPPLFPLTSSTLLFLIHPSLPPLQPHILLILPPQQKVQVSTEKAARQRRQQPGTGGATAGEGESKRAGEKVGKEREREKLPDTVRQRAASPREEDSNHHPTDARQRSNSRQHHHVNAK